MPRLKPRSYGVRIGTLPPGPRNNLGDVPGVLVGHETLVRGSGKLVVGQGPVRTGVTVVLPHGGNLFEETAPGAYWALNGCGGLQGSLQIDEFGAIETPIYLTNTMSMGDVASAAVDWTLEHNPRAGVSRDSVIPIVSECDDSYLSDIRGKHVQRSHVFAALSQATADFAEGSVGAGTGMICHDYKGGIGSASRVVSAADRQFTIGALVLTNQGDARNLVIAGVPVGRSLPEPATAAELRPQGSLVMVLGTDAPLNSRQLQRLCKRSPLGMARTGSYGSNGSGDIAIAFSTGYRVPRYTEAGVVTEPRLRDGSMSPLFEATAEAVEEAIISSLFVAGRMEGRDGHLAEALPLEAVLELLRTHRALP